jgi:hypothetical protein
MISRDMKRNLTRKRCAAIAMIMVMCFHFMSGSKLLCMLLLPLQASASDSVPHTIMPANYDSGQVRANSGVDTRNTHKPLGSCCKKGKSCPTIPRSLITSNSTHRVSEFQRLAKSASHDSSVLDAREFCYGYGYGNAIPLMESTYYASVRPSFTPLSMTCILLI